MYGVRVKNHKRKRNSIKFSTVRAYLYFVASVISTSVDFRLVTWPSAAWRVTTGPQPNTHKHLASAHKSLSYTTSANKQVAKVRGPWWETVMTQNTHAHTHTCTHRHTHFYWLMCEEISGNSQIWGHTETSSGGRLCVCLNLEDAVMTPRLNHSKSVCTSSHH